MTGPLLYGHRGACAELPENTMPAFERAVALGVDVIESDVHLTRDGVVVMSHDETGRRMAGHEEAIAATDYATVQGWDAGWGFVDDDGQRPFTGQGFCVPRLEDALTAWPDMRFNLDVKQAAPSMVGPLLRVLRAHDAEERVTLASFHTPTLHALRAAGFPGTIVLGRRHIVWLATLPRFALGWFPVFKDRVRAQIPTGAGPFRFGTTAFVDKCHALGVAVDFWTINDADEARALLDVGADGIMTDDPRAVRAAFGRGDDAQSSASGARLVS